MSATVVDDTGRTIWQAQDCAWWSRERVVELGEEFGPAGPAVANWIECQAKLQNSGGLVKAGYRSIARGAFLHGGAEEARRIVHFAVSIGFLKNLDEGAHTFTARVSAYAGDQRTGGATLRKQAQRSKKPDRAVEPKNGDESRSVPSCPGQSRFVTLRGEERREEDSTGEKSREPREVRGEEAKGKEGSGSLRSPIRATAPAAPVAPANPDQPPPDFPAELLPSLPRVVEVLARIAAERQANEVRVRAVARAMATYPRRAHLEAALELEHWLVEGTGRGRHPKDVVGYFRNQLRDRWPDQAPRPSGGRTAAPGAPPVFTRRMSAGERASAQARGWLREAERLEAAGAGA